MTGPTIRTLAVAVVVRDGADGPHLLVERGHDPVKGESYFRVPGGGVEFGERAADALRRELREELAAELDGVELLGVLENLFTYAGRPGHEIVFVFRAALRDRTLYDRDDLVVLDEGSPVSWEPLAALRDGAARLYPEGLGALLADRAATPADR